MATARASHPLSPAKRTASAGSVYTVREMSSSAEPLEPTCPISASKEQPASWALATISLVRRRFSSKGSMLPSNITEENPRPMARSTSSGVNPWSKCSATGTAARRAMPSIMSAYSSSVAAVSRLSAGPMITGERSSSAAARMPFVISSVTQLNSPTA